MKTHLLPLSLLFFLVLSCGQQYNEKPKRVILEPHKKDTAESIYGQALQRGEEGIRIVSQNIINL